MSKTSDQLQNKFQTVPTQNDFFASKSLKTGIPTLANCQFTGVNFCEPEHLSGRKCVYQ